MSKTREQIRRERFNSVLLTIIRLALAYIGAMAIGPLWISIVVYKYFAGYEYIHPCRVYYEERWGEIKDASRSVTAFACVGSFFWLIFLIGA
jgi:hypothetical protein